VVAGHTAERRPPQFSRRPFVGGTSLRRRRPACVYIIDSVVSVVPYIVITILFRSFSAHTYIILLSQCDTARRHWCRGTGEEVTIVTCSLHVVILFHDCLPHNVCDVVAPDASPALARRNFGFVCTRDSHFLPLHTYIYELLRILRSELL